MLCQHAFGVPFVLSIPAELVQGLDKLAGQNRQVITAEQDRHSLLWTGDADTTVVVQRLLEAASKPYFQMLELWLCQGVLNDPYAEFMVEEDKVTRHSRLHPIVLATF